MATANQRKPKKAYCKKAHFATDSGAKLTLQELVQHAIRSLPKAKERREVMSGGGYYRLINNFSSIEGAFCGVMVAYESGTNALTLSEEDDAEAYTIEQLAPPKNDGKRREFLDGLLYFAMRGNHVVLIQSQSLRSTEFEQHIYWLITEASKGMQSVPFSLNDSFSKRIIEQINNSHVKNIEIGAPLVVAKDANGNVLSSVERSQGTQSFTIGGIGPSILSALGGKLPSKLKLQDALDTNIEMSLQIRYVRSVSTKGQDLLDTLAVALRNQEGGDTKITLNDGSIVTGDSLKLTTTLKPMSINGVIIPDSAFIELVSWLDGLIKTGDLNP